MARRTDDQLAQLRTAQHQTTEQLAKTLANGLDDNRRETSDLRRELGDSIGAGFAELRHDNTQLRDQLTEALRDGFGSLRAENLELRARLDRAAVDLAEARRQIETMRAEAAEARIAAEPAAPTSEGAAEAEASGTDDLQRHLELLLAAANVASASLVCHRDAWAFIVEQTSRHPHFRVPGAAEDAGAGKVRVALSGPSLVAILITLRDTKRANRITDPATWAMATSLYDCFGTEIEDVGHSDQTDPSALNDIVITINDRLGPPRPKPEAETDRP